VECAHALHGRDERRRRVVEVALDRIVQEREKRRSPTRESPMRLASR